MAAPHGTATRAAPSVPAVDVVAEGLAQSFARRQKSDYGDFADAQKDEVLVLRSETETFIRACEDVVNRQSLQN